jgi:iron complex transport system substrate-binding protein
MVRHLQSWAQSVGIFNDKIGSGNEIDMQYVWQWLCVAGLILLITIGGHSTADRVKDRLPSSIDCRTVRHVAGETCLPKVPQRTIAISQFTTGNVLSLESKPIAVASALSDLESSPAYLQSYLGNAIELGSQYQPNLEKILKLKPDAIVGWAPVRTIYPLLSRISPTALGAWKGPQSWREHLEFVSRVLGKEDLLKKSWDAYATRMKALKSTLAPKYRGKTVAVISLDGNSITSWLDNSFSGSILRDAGLTRLASQRAVSPAKDRIRNFSVEKLDQLDADIIFVQAFRSRDRQHFDKLTQGSLWQKLKAVRQGKVYMVDGFAWVGSNLIAIDVVINDLDIKSGSNNL